jgi:hypothetical protein
MTPSDLATLLAANLPIVLAYVGVAVGAGVVIMFTLVGIKKGLSWARAMVADRQWRNDVNNSTGDYERDNVYADDWL